MTQTKSTALPIAYVALRILIILNWFYGACLLALLIFSSVNEAFFMRALQLGSPADNLPLVWGVRAVAALGILTVPINLAMLKRMVAMVETVRRSVRCRERLPSPGHRLVPPRTPNRRSRYLRDRKSRVDACAPLSR
jgi:hypothetical protein